MSHPLRALNRAALAGLAEALVDGRIGSPVARSAVAAHVADEHLDSVWTALAQWERNGMAPRHIASAIKLLVEEREAAQRMSDRVQLVFSPPELDAVDARDTSVVVQDLFRRAQSSVLISTFAVDEKRKAHTLFGGLAARMDADPNLDVRIFANIHRPHLDETPSVELVREFALRIREDVWPGTRLPDVFYDPRSLETEGYQRAVLHAKLVVVDRRWTLVTSANLTEAAHERNIEAGVVVDDAGMTARVTRQFDELAESALLVPIRF